MIIIQRAPASTDERFDRLLGIVLRTGVLASAVVVLCGAAIYLSRHFTERPEVHIFHGEPDDLRTIGGVLNDAWSLSGRGLIQLGVLLLIATPVARVVFSLVGFLRDCNWLYVSIASVVMILLAYALTSL